MIEAIGRLPLPVFTLARDGRLRWLNEAARRLVGERTGVHFSKIVAPESLRLAQREFAKKIVGTATSSEYDANLLRADGTRVPVEISSVALTGNGHIVGVFGTAHVDGQPQRPTGSASSSLTPRQTEVLRLLAHGCSTVQIAEHLHLSTETVRNHIRATLGRLGVHSRLEAVALAHREGLI